MTPNDKHLIGAAESVQHEAALRGERIAQLEETYLEDIKAGQAQGWLEWVDQSTDSVLEQLYAIAQRKGPAMLALAEIQVLLAPLAVAASEAYAEHEVDKINWDEENVPEWEYEG
jgi:hypothetical protein